MKTINLKGKEYCQVVERLRQFRADHATWSIETDVKASSGGVLASAVIKDEEGRVISTGHGFKPSVDEFVLEKTETRAVGRALAFLGLGVDGSIASAEEVQEATGGQE